MFKPKQVWQNPYYYNQTFYYRYKLTSLPPHQFACVSKFNSHYLKFDGKPIGCYSGTQLCLKLSNTAKRQWITFLHWKVGCLNTKSGSRDSSTSTMPGRSGFISWQYPRFFFLSTETRLALGTILSHWIGEWVGPTASLGTVEKKWSRSTTPTPIPRPPSPQPLHVSYLCLSARDWRHKPTDQSVPTR